MTRQRTDEHGRRPGDFANVLVCLHDALDARGEGVRLAAHGTKLRAKPGGKTTERGASARGNSELSGRTQTHAGSVDTQY